MRAILNGKVVFCNCDDPRNSNFFNYFSRNFENFGLSKLISACYKEQETDHFIKEENEKAIFHEYIGKNEPDQSGDATNLIPFKETGDFRSLESIELLKKSDIVVKIKYPLNPPHDVNQP